MRDHRGMGGGAGRSAFVGRAAELDALDARLAELSEGRAAVVLLAGEAGMGKSRLAGELRTRAEAAGALAATGRTPVEGAALPYGTIVGLVRDLARKLGPRETADLLEPVQRLLMGSPEETDAPGALTRLRLFEAVLRAVEGLASARPLVLALEDLHWADPGTVELLDYLVRNVEDDAVLLAATYRPEEVDRRDAVRRVLAELRRHPATTVLELAGLSRDEVGALVSAITGESPSWTVVDAIHRRSDGNPLFAEELIGVRDDSALPPALRDLLAVRIDQLPPGPRSLVDAAAVLGVSADHRLLERVAEVETADVDAALGDAVRHRVLVTDGPGGMVRFRHALLQQAAHDALLPALRTRLHRRAAEALVADPSLAAAGRGHAAAALAEHRFEAGEWAAACEASIAAAQASMGLYAIHAAHAHLQRALAAHRLAAGACAHPDVDDSELHRLAAETAALISELEEAHVLAEAALDALPPDAPPERVLASQLLSARCHWNVGHAERAMATIAAAEAQLPDPPSGAAAAELATIHARLLMGAGRMTECIARCEEALALTREAGTRIAEGHVLATLGPCLAEIGELDRGLGTIEEAAAVAEEVGDPDLLIRTYINLTHVQMTCGRLDETADLVTTVMDDASPLGMVRLGGVGVNATEALIVLGRWDEAERLGALMMGKARAACTSDTLNNALLAVRRGDLEAAEAELERRPPTAAAAIAQRELLLAEIALERGTPDDATAAVDRALAAIVGFDAHHELLHAHALGLRALADQAAQPVRPGRRHATDPAKLTRLAESKLAEVEEWVHEAARRVARLSPWIEAFAAQCRAEASRVRGPDTALWAAAVDAWQVLGAPFDVAYARLRYAEALLAARADRRDATASLADAWRTARDLGAARLAAACERLAERARITLDDPGGSAATPRERAAVDLGLTPREAEVLDLLACGRTDGQIAEELFVSKKTASVHVSNILRKLDARDRWHAGDVGRAAGLGTPT